MRSAPWNLGLERLSPDQRERWLQRVHVPDRLAAVQEVDAEVGNSDRSHLPLFHQLDHCCPGLLDGGASLVRPVNLVEINLFHGQSAQRGLALGSDRGWIQNLARWGRSILLIPHQSALGEDIGAFPGADAIERSTDD